MADNMRTCRKTACRWPAAASLSYRYDSRQVWLHDLSEEADPSLYDLCPPHADALVVPQGWERVDQRTHTEPVVEPAGRDLLAVPGRVPVGPGGYGGDRYEALRADLPRLAEELATEAAGDGPSRAAESEGNTVRPDPGAAADGAPEPDADRWAGPATLRHPAAPRPSRDLAPVAVDDGPPPPARVPRAPATDGRDAGDGLQGRDGLREPDGRDERDRADARGAAGSQDSSAAAHDQVPGQLAIPVPEDEPDVGEAVVVSIEAGRRRSPVSR